MRYLIEEVVPIGVAIEETHLVLLSYTVSFLGCRWILKLQFALLI